MSNQAQHWTPCPYPTQTCNGHWDHDHSTLTSPLPAEPAAPVPQTIRAVQESSSPHKGRSLVICLDGTGDKFDNDNSNVVNFVACLKKDDPAQVTYYQSGIGTYDGHGLKNGISAAIDMAVGSGLGIHIKDAYHFLMQNYREGDRICLLGFSRGSYTVRCLAGMLHKVGLLPRHNSAQVSFAYRFYKDDTDEGWQMSAEFKRAFCTNVEVYFVGVWDCVASVGFIPRKLPFSKSPTNTIHYFRHAMALDEHRAKFKICQWQQQDKAVTSKFDTAGKKPDVKVKSEGNHIAALFKSCFGPAGKSGVEDSADKRPLAAGAGKLDLMEKFSKEKDSQEKLEAKFEAADSSVHQHVKTDVAELWFAGAHADVGGGAVHNSERHMLSRIPLRWMIRQCFSCNTSILFSTSALAEAGLDIQTLFPIYTFPKRPVVGPSPDMVEQYEAKSLPPLRRRSTALGVKLDREQHGAPGNPNGDERKMSHNGTLRGDIYADHESGRFNAEILPEQVEDYFDAMARINDQLHDSKGWWVLEFWPVKVRVQKKETEEWQKKVRMNMGRYRAIRETEPQMHWTVQMRMGDKGYKIRNRVGTEAIWEVVS